MPVQLSYELPDDLDDDPVIRALQIVTVMLKVQTAQIEALQRECDRALELASDQDDRESA